MHQAPPALRGGARIFSSVRKTCILRKAWTMSMKIALVIGCFTALCCGQTNNSTQRIYVIGSTEKVTVRVSNQENLSGEFAVGSNGMISMPLIGGVKAEGLTRRQLQEAITERLKEYLREGEVDVRVVKSGKQQP